jgi:glutamine amidotransferase
VTVVIVDIGVGNISSVANALHYLGKKYLLTDNIEKINNSHHLILPGVGSFDGVIKALEKKKLIIPIKNHILKNEKPFLGICVGMQILFKTSEEGNKEGLNIFKGNIRKLNYDRNFKDNKVPNVGYKKIFGFKTNGIFKNFDTTENFYFTHSFAAIDIKENKKTNIAYCQHNLKFIAAINYKNISGVQFHPEKSQSIGLKLINNFLEL